MAGTPGFANYCPDQRYQHWKSRFDRDCDKVFESFHLEHQHVKDPNDIYLTNVTDQLDTWEKRLQSYVSNHKTDLFYDFQDDKSKLLIKLDNIDVSSNPARRENRLKIYDRVNTLAKNLDAKIHSGHALCQECVQVKVVMLNV